MPTVNLTEAAKLAGYNRSYFHQQFIKSGKLSTTVDGRGKPAVDISELLRVFPNIKLPTVDQTEQTDTTQHVQTAEPNTKNNTETAVLQVEVKLLREQLQEYKDREQMLMEQLGKMTDTIKQLEHKPAPAGFWARLFGGK